MTKDEKWTEGRDRHVRVYLTEDEHALVRAAAAKVDRSVSRFAVEAIVAAAEVVIEAPAPPASPPEPPPTSRPRGRPRKPPAEPAQVEEPPAQEEEPPRKGKKK